MAKNNRVKITQSMTCSFKKDDILYIKTEAKRLEKTSAQILAEAINLHRNLSEGLEILANMEKLTNVTDERSNLTPAS